MRTTGDVAANELAGRYFHFLVPEVDELKSHDDEWQGKLVAMERTIKSEGQKIERRLNEQHTLTDKKIDELAAHCSKIDKETTENKVQEENWRRHIEERTDRMETAMHQILHKLDAIGPSSSRATM